ncbi:hypothetical protein KKA47_03215 [bacterium]|nr:hypothetical protein [bacterium]
MKRKKNMEKRSFLKMLMESNLSLKKMAPNEIHIFNINANYGHYQISIGPEYSANELRKLGLPKRSRPIEINGEMHHLFVSQSGVNPIPSKEQVDSNLKNTVILKDLIIHIQDKKGDGSSISIQKMNFDGVRPRNNINLAGEEGTKLIEKIQRSGTLNKEAYKIIQEDILKSVGTKK